MKQRSNCGHFWPVQRSERASILAQAVLISGSVLISARSPVSVVFSHCADDLEIGDLFQALEHRLLFGVVDFLAAGVVGAALHVADAQRRPRCFCEERDVFEEKLFLKILGAGGNDDAACRKEWRGPDRRASCRCRCRPRQSDAFFRRARIRRLRPSRAGRREIRNSGATQKAVLLRPKNWRTVRVLVETDTYDTILALSNSPLFPRAAPEYQTPGTAKIDSKSRWPKYAIRTKPSLNARNQAKGSAPSNAQI